LAVFSTTIGTKFDMGSPGYCISITYILKKNKCVIF